MVEANEVEQWGGQAANMLARVDGGAETSQGLGFFLNGGFVLASVGPELPTFAALSAYVAAEEPTEGRLAEVIQADGFRLAVFDLGRWATEPGNYGPVSLGDPFGSAFAFADGNHMIVTGSVTSDGRFILDHEVPMLSSALGAPVVQHGVVVGVIIGRTEDGVHVVSMEALAEQLESYAPEVRRDVRAARPPVVPDDFSKTAWKALCLFDRIASRDDQPVSVASALWIAVLLVQRESRSRFADAVAKGRAAIPPVLSDVEPSPAPDPRRLSILTPVLDEARRVRDQTSPGDTVRMRHLVTAALREWPFGLAGLGEDPADLQGRLLELVARHYPADQHEAWQSLLGGLIPPSPPVVATWAGYSNDIADVQTDELHVQADVETLCSVLAAKDAVPPLAVGLFGRWGAGKSTFMKLMQSRMSLLAETAESATAKGQATAYCTDIVQIEFNAWHYMDANLWASLAVRIFEGLSVGGDADHDDHEAAELLAQLHERERKLAPVDAKIGLAVQDQRLSDVAAQLGVEASRQQIVKLFGQVSRFRRLLRALRLAVFDPRRWTADRRRTALLLIVLTALATAAVVLLAPWQSITALGPSVVAFLAAAWKVVPPAVNALTNVNGVLEAAGLKPAEVDERVEGDRQIAQIKERLAKLDRRQGLYEFVLERAGSEDYRKHFGLISVVRGDFEKLAKRLADDAPGRRIVLYIDDLDRCPPDRVVEVLQAVHLLLAFKLFVVVVGVDPRWLLRSLERQYRTVLSSGERNGDRPQGDEAFLESTPQNYLEKIFQIPFALRAMDVDGFGRLVDGMFGPDTSLADAVKAKTTPPSSDSETAPSLASTEPSTEAPTEAPPPPPQGVAAQQAAAPGSAPTQASASAETVPPSPIDPNPVALRASKEEVDFMRSVGRLVKTPREAKRLVNLYRLVRASRPPDKLDAFIADADYEAVITLLAVLVGFRRQARGLFEALVEASSDVPVDSGSAGTWRDLLVSAVQKSGADDEAWDELSEELLRLDGERETPASVDHYSRWVPVVERYSFDTALAAAAPPSDRTAKPAKPAKPAKKTSKAGNQPA